MSRQTAPEDGGRIGTKPGRREFLAALFVVLCGALLVLLASLQRWADVVVDVTVSVPPSVYEELEGHAVAPAARALGLVGLAGTVALAATRRVGRRLVGVVLALAGVGTVLASLFWTAETSWSPGAGDATVPLRITDWSWVSVFGGALLVAGGVWAIARAGSWPTMGERYDRAASPAGSDAWSALDRGEDPTR